MADIDHFKDVNDNHGHDVGDEVLKNLASLLSQSVRREDSVCRWGGEEFLLMIPSADLEQGRLVAEKIRKRVESSPLECGDERISVTMTLGVALFDDGMTLEKAIKVADVNLYEGKNAGRNRVVA